MRCGIWLIVGSLGLGWLPSAVAYRESSLLPVDAVAGYEPVVATGVAGWAGSESKFASLRSAVVDPRTGGIAFIGEMEGGTFGSAIWFADGDRVEPRLVEGRELDGHPGHQLESFLRLVGVQNGSVVHVSTVRREGEPLAKAFCWDSSAIVEGQQIGFSDRGASEDWTVDELIGTSISDANYVTVRLSGPGIANADEVRLYELEWGTFAAFEPIAASESGGFDFGLVEGKLKISPLPLASGAWGATVAVDTIDRSSGLPVAGEGLVQVLDSSYQIWDGRPPVGSADGTSVEFAGGIATNRDHSWAAVALVAEPGQAAMRTVLGNGAVGSRADKFDDVVRIVQVGAPAPWAGPEAVIGEIVGGVAVGATAEILPYAPDAEMGTIQVVQLRIVGPGIDSANDDCLVLFDRAGRPFVLVREGAVVGLEGGWGGLVTAFDFTASSVTDADEVAVVLELDGSRDVLVRAKLVAPKAATPEPTPVPSGPAVTVAAVPELRIKGSGKSRTSKFRVNEGRFVLRGRLLGGEGWIEWKKLPGRKIRTLKSGPKLRLRVRVKEGRNRLKFRTVGMDGQRSRWQRVIVTRQGSGLIRSPRSGGRIPTVDRGRRPSRGWRSGGLVLR